ncbi:MAG: sulfate transporter CysZ [Halioglobus sp.]|nr:sulfate transporter CysZ [Halioglobus sp.]
MQGNIARGAGYLTRGAKLLNHPSLRAFVIVPLIINILIFGTLIALGFSYISDLMDSMLASIPGWMSFITWILWPLIIVTVSLIAGYFFTSVALIIASPFNALLAEKAEELVTGQPVNSLEGFGAALASIPKSVVRELLKLLYYIPMALLALVLSFIPGVGAAAWLLLGAWMMSIQFVDYPMDNHQLSFAEVKRAVRSKRLSSLGFGGLVAVCTSIPLVNFFVVPAAVVGATLLWCEELNQ